MSNEKVEKVKKTFDRYSKRFIVRKEQFKDSMVKLIKSSEKKYSDKFMKILTKEERAQWYAIETDLKSFHKEVYSFASDVIARLEVVHRRAGNVKYTSLSECYDGFSPEETSEEVKKLKDICTTLFQDLQAFREDVGGRVKGSTRKEKIVSESVANVLGVVVLGSSTFAAVTMSTTPLIAAGLGSAIVAGVDNRLNQSKTKKEDRFLKYLENFENDLFEHLTNIEGNVNEVETSTKEVYTSTATFVEGDREIVQEKLQKMIDGLKEMKNLIEMAQRPREEKGNEERCGENAGLSCENTNDNGWLDVVKKSA